jgi:hypothetical protein
MSFEAVRQIAETRFFNSYSSQNAKAHGAVAFVEGRDIIQPTKSLSNNGTPWVVLGVVDGGSRERAFNRGMRKTSGFIRFSLYVERGAGTKVIREIADYIDSIMGFQNGDDSTGNLGNLYTQVGQLRQQSDDENGYLKYVIDFDYDYYE